MKTKKNDEWTTTVLGSLQLSRDGEPRGFVMTTGFWRTTGAEMGSEKDPETAKIALVAAIDAVDLRGAS